MSLKQKILEAAKAFEIPAGSSGLWTVRKFSLVKPLEVERERGRRVLLPRGDYTQLFCYTESTMHLMGECVMHDTPEELNKHLDFMLRAHGRVLITGLGLGCVLRGCLANPEVRHCVVIERSRDVLNLVAPYLPKDRFTIIVADAIEWCKKPRRFDCAWHDIWTDTDRGEQSLALAHAELIGAMADRVEFQGAWDFPREYRRLFRDEAQVI